MTFLHAMYLVSAVIGIATMIIVPIVCAIIGWAMLFDKNADRDERLIGFGLLVATFFLVCLLVFCGNNNYWPFINFN